MDVRHHLAKISQHPLVSERPVVKEFIKFSIVGALNTIVDFIFFSIFLYVFHVHYLVANSIAVAAASTNSYFFNRRWTWRIADPRWRQQLAKFFVVVVAGCFLNELLSYILVDHIHVAPLVGKSLAVIIVLLMNFAANRWWTFKVVG